MVIQSRHENDMDSRQTRKLFPSDPVLFLKVICSALQLQLSTSVVRCRLLSSGIEEHLKLPSPLGEFFVHKYW